MLNQMQFSGNTVEKFNLGEGQKKGGGRRQKVFLK